MITLNNITALRGLSTDTKPTEGVLVNTTFWEMDTDDYYYFTGETWAKVGGAKS